MRKLFGTRPASAGRPFCRSCYTQLSYGHRNNKNGFLVRIRQPVISGFHILYIYVESLRLHAIFREHAVK